MIKNKVLELKSQATMVFSPQIPTNISSISLVSVQNTHIPLLDVLLLV